MTDKHGTQTVSHRGVCPSAVHSDADGDGGYKPRAGDMWLPVLLLPSVHGGFTEGSVAATALLCGVWHSDKAVFFFFFQMSDLEAITPFRFIPVFTLSTVFFLILP